MLDLITRAGRITVISEIISRERRRVELLPKGCLK